jgi:hypothetical protein
MDLHDRPIQADRFDLDADNLLFLHLFEQLIQHAGFLAQRFMRVCIHIRAKVGTPEGTPAPGLLANSNRLPPDPPFAHHPFRTLRSSRRTANRDDDALKSVDLPNEMIAVKTAS